MPLRPLSDAVSFAYICMALVPGSKEVTVLMYSGDFSLEELAECFSRLVKGEVATLAGASGLCGRWTGTESCLCSVLHVVVSVYIYM